MFDIKISDEQKIYVANLLKQTNYGQRGEFDGNYERQFTGILGEVVFADMYSLNRPTGGGDYDDGIDFILHGQNIDLKTMGRNCNVRPFFVHNLIKTQVEQSKTDQYIFASINKSQNIITFCGIMHKAGLRNTYLKGKNTRRYRSDGTYFNAQMDMYEIPQNQLKQVSGPEDLYWAIDQLKI